LLVCWVIGSSAALAQPSPTTSVSPNRLVARDAEFVEIDLTGGGRTPIPGASSSATESRPFHAFNPYSNSYYSINPVNRNLVRIDADSFDSVELACTGVDALNVLTFNDDDGVLYGFDDLTRQVYLIDSIDDLTTLVLPITDPLPTRLTGLAFDHDTGQLLATTPHGLLYSIDPYTGGYHIVGPTGYDELRQLTYYPPTGSFLAFQYEDDKLISIDPSTGLGTQIGPMPFYGIWYMVYNPFLDALISTYVSAVVSFRVAYSGNVMYDAPNPAPNTYPIPENLTFDHTGLHLYVSPRVGYAHVYRIDVFTGHIEYLGFSSATYLSGWLFHPSERMLYAAADHGTKLVRIHPQTLQTEHVCDLSASVTTITYDASNARIVGSTDWPRRLVSIDTLDCSIHDLGPPHDLKVYGLTSDGDSERLYATFEQSNDVKTLVSIDPTTGHVTYIGPLRYDRVVGLAYDPNLHRLYGLDARARKILDIDSDEMSWYETIGAYNTKIRSGTAYDSAAGAVYGIGWPWLLRLDETTGETAPVCQFENYPDTLCAADAATNTYYAVHDGFGYVVKIDASMCVTTALAFSGREIEQLAFDDSTRTLYAVAHSVYDYQTYELLVLDSENNTATVIGTTDPNITAMTYDARSDELYVIAGAPRILATLDRTTGAMIPVTGFPLGTIRHLAPSAIGPGLLGYHEDLWSLVRIDTITGELNTLFGNWGRDCEPYVYSPRFNKLCGICRYGRMILEVDLAGAGARYSARRHATWGLEGITYDSNRDLLYSMSGDGLIAINPRTGAMALRGFVSDPLYFTVFTYNPRNDRIYAYDEWCGMVLINPENAQWTTLPSADGGASPCAYDPDTDTFVAHWGTDIFAIDPTTGEVTTRLEDVGHFQWMTVAPNAPNADFNFDGLIDLADFADFHGCVAGPGVPRAADCFPGDVDADGDVDLVDFGMFQRMFSAD